MVNTVHPLNFFLVLLSIFTSCCGFLMVLFPWLKAGLRPWRILSKSLVKALIHIWSMNAGYFWPPLSAWPLEWITAPVHDVLTCLYFVYACWNTTHTNTLWTFELHSASLSVPSYSVYPALWIYQNSRDEKAVRSLSSMFTSCSSLSLSLLTHSESSSLQNKVPSL